MWWVSILAINTVAQKGIQVSTSPTGPAAVSINILLLKTIDSSVLPHEDEMIRPHFEPNIPYLIVSNNTDFTLKCRIRSGGNISWIFPTNFKKSHWLVRKFKCLNQFFSMCQPDTNYFNNFNISCTGNERKYNYFRFVLGVYDSSKE